MRNTKMNHHFIKHIPKQNFYTLLSMPLNTFDLDLKKMKQIYYNKQMQYHPDKHVHLASSFSKEQINAYSNELNIAYSTLKDPLSRAIYLLSFSRPYNKEQYSDIEQHMFMLEHIYELKNENSETKIKTMCDKLIADKAMYYGLMCSSYWHNDLNAFYESTENFDKQNRYLNLLI